MSTRAAPIDAAAKRAALLRSQLFQAMRPAELDAVLARSVTREAARGDVVMRKGDPGTGLVVILRGGLRISSTTADGQEATLTVLGPGEILGEISLLDGLERSADATAIEASTLLLVDRREFLGLLRNSSDLCLRLMEILCARLRLANLTIEDMALLDLSGRLGKVLLRLARDYGSPVPGGGVRLGLKLSQTDLGLLAGGSREKVNRELRALEQQGVLGKQDGRIVILRPGALVRLQDRDEE